MGKNLCRTTFLHHQTMTWNRRRGGKCRWKGTQGVNASDFRKKTRATEWLKSVCLHFAHQTKRVSGVEKSRHCFILWHPSTSMNYKVGLNRNETLLFMHVWLIFTRGNCPKPQCFDSRRPCSGCTWLGRRSLKPKGLSGSPLWLPALPSHGSAIAHCTTEGACIGASWTLTHRSRNCGDIGSNRKVMAVTWQ